MVTLTPKLGLHNPEDPDDANDAVRVWRTADNLVLDEAVVRAPSGVIAGYTVPSCRVYRTTNQSIPGGVATALGFDAERFDNDAIHDTAVNNGRLTCRTAGAYLIGVTAAWAASGAGSLRQLQVRLNGATLLAAQDGTPAAYDQTATTLWQLGVGDYVEVWVYQDTGGALAVTASPNYSPEFWMARIG